MLSAIILTKNEEHNLTRCLKSLSCVDEIIIVDDLSEDKTIEIAERYKAQVYQNNLKGDFAQQRNFGMEKAKGDWLLFIDADEEVTKELAEEIKRVVSLTNKKTSESELISAYAIKRRDYFWETELKHGEVSKIYNYGLIRLVRKGAGSWKGNVHEEFITKGQTETLSAFLNHYPHPTVKDFLHHINIYSTLRARELYAQGKKSSLFELITFPCGKFIWTYFVKAGFWDGPAGFTYAFFMSFHSFLVRAKLYQYIEIDPKQS